MWLLTKNTLHCSILNETSPYVLFQKWEKWPGDEVHPVCALGHCCIVKGALLQHNLSQTQIHEGIPVIKHTSNYALEMEKTRQTFVHKIFTYQLNFSYSEVSLEKKVIFQRVVVKLVKKLRMAVAEVEVHDRLHDLWEDEKIRDLSFWQNSFLDAQHMHTLE